MGFKCPFYGGYTGPQLLSCKTLIVKMIIYSNLSMYTLLIDVKENQKQISNNGESKSEMQVDLVALTISCS